MKEPFSPEEIGHMIGLWSGGSSWAQIGRALGRTADSCQIKAYRLRKAGRWPQHPEREESDGTPGRPPNRVPTKAVFVRLSAAVDAALAELVAELDVQPGVIVADALRLYLGDRVEDQSLRTELPRRRKRGTIKDKPKRQARSVQVPADLYDAVERYAVARDEPPQSVGAVAHEAVVALLVVVGWRVERL